MAKEKDQEAFDRIVSAGATLGGAGTGAAVGTLVAGPVGAVVGAGTGWAIQQCIAVGAEFARRHLAPRSEMRVGAVIGLAAEQISARLMAGELPAEDLREEITPGRTPAAELQEAILRASAEEHEERKLPYLANLLAALTFEQGLSNAHRNQLVLVADQLTYRQLVALAVYEDLGSPTGIAEFAGEAPTYDAEAPELQSLRAELLDLFRRGLVTVPARSRQVRKEQPPKPPTSRRGTGANWQIDRYAFEKDDLPWPAIPEEVNMREMQLSPSGALLARLMRLGEVPQHDRDRLFISHVRIRDW